MNALENRLARLRGHIRPDLWRNLRAQLLRGESEAAARGMATLERRLLRGGDRRAAGRTKGDGHEKEVCG